MENEEILIPTKAVTPIGDFGCQSFPLIEGNVYNATKEELAKLGKHELKWSSEEYEAEEPVYEDVEEQREVQVPDETKPIERDGIIVGYEDKTLVFSETKRVQVGTRTVTKTRPILVENDPSAENLKSQMLARIAELKKNLSDTDYEAIKYAEGEMTFEEYEPYKTKRANWRTEINALEEELSSE